MFSFRSIYPLNLDPFSTACCWLRKKEEIVRGRFLVRMELRRLGLGLVLHRISHRPKNCASRKRTTDQLVISGCEGQVECGARTLLFRGVGGFGDRNWLVENLETCVSQRTKQRQYYLFAYSAWDCSWVLKHPLYYIQSVARYVLLSSRPSNRRTLCAKPLALFVSLVCLLFSYI